MKTRQQYLDRVVESFDNDWNIFQGNLKESIDDLVKFADVVDLVETIQGTVYREFQYHRLFHEGNAFTTFTDGELYVPLYSDNPIRDYNRLYRNLMYSFADDGTCSMVRLRLNGAREFNKYLISTDDLYNMDREMFNRRIMSRVIQGITLIDAEYRRIGCYAYMCLMKMMASNENYAEDPRAGFLFRESLYDEFYDVLEHDELDVFGFQRE